MYLSSINGTTPTAFLGTIGKLTCNELDAVLEPFDAKMRIVGWLHLSFQSHGATFL